MEGPLDQILNNSPRASRRPTFSDLILPALSAMVDVDIPTFKSYYCFLFNDILVFTKEKRDHYVFESKYELKDLEVMPKEGIRSFYIYSRLIVF